MTGFELRAEHRPADPVGRQVVRWHLVRIGRLEAQCRRLIDPVSDTRPLREADEVSPEQRCTDCWDWWDVIREMHGP